jgi:2-keto-4-pentenoate hydratase
MKEESVNIISRVVVAPGLLFLAASVVPSAQGHASGTNTHPDYARAAAELAQKAVETGKSLKEVADEEKAEG